MSNLSCCSPTPGSGEAAKPIPAFYCAYLLRSSVRHASLYIGSTPNPSRRLAQHNGRIKGGAHKTHREKLRPWEMVMIVSGFTSRTGALQFEWAWQHTVLSRHKASNHESAVAPSVRICPKTGKPRKGSTRPRDSMTSVMSRLHLLLRSPYFSSWPLEIRFFASDVHTVWRGWGDNQNDFIPEPIKVVTEFFNVDLSHSSQPPQDALKQLDTSNRGLRRYMEKSRVILDTNEQLVCGVCRRFLDLMDEMIVICSADGCQCASHLLCLSSAFLQSEESNGDFVPSSGNCPKCHSHVSWPVLMKELTQRIYTPKTERSLRSNGPTLGMLEEDSECESDDGVNPQTSHHPLNEYDEEADMFYTPEGLHSSDNAVCRKEMSRVAMAHRPHPRSSIIILDDD
ncbi:Slx4p interacting protein [Myotisia sp. PD_48]|nr:Slx4p interacting protein [Myotisia sp. PD_48]